MPEDLRSEIRRKEHEITLKKNSVRQERRSMARKEDEIGDKHVWIRQSKNEIKVTEQWIKQSIKDVSLLKEELLGEVSETEGKKAWVQQEKQKFPLDFPECQDDN